MGDLSHLTLLLGGSRTVVDLLLLSLLLLQNRLGDGDVILGGDAAGTMVRVALNMSRRCNSRCAGHFAGG